MCFADINNGLSFVMNSNHLCLDANCSFWSSITISFILVIFLINISSTIAGSGYLSTISDHFLG